jgi:sugar phosphate permease
MQKSSRRFRGPWIVAAAFVTSGLTVGVPYYNIGFFYDYFQREFGWSRAAITLGFPLASLLTIWAGPLLIHRLSARKLIAAGSLLIGAALLGFGRMGASLNIYYLLWMIYTAGYILAGPIPHQLIISYCFRRTRGKAMGVVYAGNGLVGSLGSLLVPMLTGRYGFHAALAMLGGLVAIAAPISIAALRDKPADLGQNPDGDDAPPAEAARPSHTFGELLGSYTFWLLLVGSFCSIGSLGAINFHLKFVLLDRGFAQGAAADSAWRTASVMILWASIAGRLIIGGIADRFSKKSVMTATYVLVAVTIPMLLAVRPANPTVLYTFAILFGLGLGADYMLIPLMAADRFGINSLARAMAIILPVNTIGQTWFPYFVSILRDRLGSYGVAMSVVGMLAGIGAISIAILPRRASEFTEEKV